MRRHSLTAVAAGLLERSGFELFSRTLDVPDVVRWGIPIVSIVVGVTTARANRLATESGLF